MARKKWIDKKNAAHFTLVHRPQEDPLIHDDSVPSSVLNPIPIPNSNKPKKLHELALELGSEIENRRQNEGEAANYGIFFDDTEYDYMRHMRDLGSALGQSHFVEAPLATTRDKGKEKLSLDKALEKINLTDSVQILLDQNISFSKNLSETSYQAQQDVPDTLAGFQPDMNPRLREVLIALEDDRYLDDQDDFFHELTKDRQEIDQDEFDQNQWDEENDWDSDTTAKPTNECQIILNSEKSVEIENNESEVHGDELWMERFTRFKREQKPRSTLLTSSLISSDVTDKTNGYRKKKRKGALTNPSNYSMTSSSLYRTEGLTALDARFEKIDEQYNQVMDETQSVSQISTASVLSGTQNHVREDFDSIMDEFLGGYSMSNKKYVKNQKTSSGLEELDEIRKGLGPAIIRS